MQNTDFSGTGYLKVRVYSASGAFPVEGAAVLVYDSDGDLTSSLRTDSSGLTETIPLPAPPASLSQTPDTAALPYTVYTVTASKDGFGLVEDFSVPVFDSITSIQGVNMIPLSTPAPRVQRVETPGYPFLEGGGGNGQRS